MIRNSICEQQQIGFEPLIMEFSGGMVGETATLLSSLCGVIDRYAGLLLGCTWQECQIRLVIDLHRGLQTSKAQEYTFKAEEYTFENMKYKLSKCKSTP